jgi:dihydroorotate dehydrogenase electron transfer subunit
VKLHRVQVLHRERFGDHALIRYHWTGPPPDPGQFVMVRPASASPILDPFLARPFFAHDHEGGTMSLLFEVRGRGTLLLAEDGNELLVSAPRGRGFEVRGGPVVLVGGGVWVAPLKLLSRRLEQASVSHDTYIEVPRDVPKDYAAWLARGYLGARFVHTEGTAGSPQMLFEEIGDLRRYSAVYASGSGETLAATKEVSEGRVAAQLALRARMACANGSCYGCAVPVLVDGDASYARACVDGPVFLAEALAW